MKNYPPFKIVRFLAILAVAGWCLSSCNPYKKELEAAKQAKEEAEKKLKEEKDALKTIYNK